RTCSHNLEKQIKKQKAKGKRQKSIGPPIVLLTHFCLLPFAFCFLICLFHLATPAAFAAPSFAPVALSTKARKTLSCSPAACRSATIGRALLIEASITGECGMP